MLSRIVHTLLRRRREPEPEVPTLDDLLVLGYDHGVATTALRYLEAERTTGRMRCDRKPSHRDGWYVTLETAQATTKPSEYRWELGDRAHDVVADTLPLTGGGAA